MTFVLTAVSEQGDREACHVAPRASLGRKPWGFERQQSPRLFDFPAASSSLDVVSEQRDGVTKKGVAPGKRQKERELNLLVESKVLNLARKLGRKGRKHGAGGGHERG